MTDVIAMIITYNPDIELLARNLRGLVPQVDEVVIYDNASKNVDELIEKAQTFPRTRVVRNRKNIGLPRNYNRALAYAVKSAGWLLILDQDTVLPEDYISKASRYFHKKDLALICPLFWDINVESRESFMASVPHTPYTYVKQCISSGTLLNTKKAAGIDPFDEKMFIDYVDYDYCKNLEVNHLKILRMNDCVIEHQIGNSRKVTLLGRPQIIHNHSPFRKYYFYRNRMYYARKWKLNPVKHFRFYYGFLKNLILIGYEKEDRFKKVQKSLKGIIDGMKMEV